MVLAVRYAFFALLATLTNIICQDAAARVYRGIYELYVSMGVGTLAGLAVKYLLDKKYIFSFRSRTVGQDARRFFLYSAMGGVTTCVFWGAEVGFDRAFGNLPMRYVGASLGLALGYWIKYHLDKRFVFVESV